MARNVRADVISTLFHGGHESRPGSRHTGQEAAVEVPLIRVQRHGDAESTPFLADQGCEFANVRSPAEPLGPGIYRALVTKGTRARARA